MRSLLFPSVLLLACSSSGGPAADAGSSGSGPSAGGAGMAGGQSTGGAATAGGATTTGGSASGGATTTGGSMVSGGVEATGGSNPDSDGGQTNAPHVVHECPTDGSTVGVWENITPPPAVTEGALSFVIDPSDTSIVYVGTSSFGLFKSTDCGANWTHINTGTNGASLDPGMEGSIAIDPVDPKVIYLDDRYGAMGVFKSTNAGVDWEQILPDDIASAFVYNGMVEWIAMDPKDHLHLVVSPHFSCQGEHAPNCMLETSDGGTSWRVIDDVPESTELGGQMILDSTTWLSAQPFNGLFRTTDSGASWTKVHTGTYPYIHRDEDGAYYVPAVFDGVIKSTDDGVTWTPLGQGGPLAESLAVSDSAFFTSTGLNGNSYSTASLSEPSSWSSLSGPDGASIGGWQLKYDQDHHILYSANFSAGFFSAS